MPPRRVTYVPKGSALPGWQDKRRPLWWRLLLLAGHVLKQMTLYKRK